MQLKKSEASNDSQVRKEKIRHRLRQYGKGEVTLARAAEEAGSSVREMMEYLRQQKIPLQYDMEDFERDLKGIYDRLGKK